MDRICPYLALAGDGRTVMDGIDPEHRCHAVTPPEPIDRTRQAGLCLIESHTECVRFLAAREAWVRSIPPVPRPAPDAFLPRTRLILEAAPNGRRASAGAAPQRARRRWVVAGTAGLLSVAAAASAASGQLDGMLGVRPVGTDAPAASSSTAQTPLPSASSAAEAASPTPTPSASASPGRTPQPSVATSSSPVPSASAPRTYTVVAGDYLGAIAARFGTTVAAIRAANGIEGDVINVGQQLIIP